MTSKEYHEIVNKMLDMQEKLDESIMKEYGLKEIDRNKLKFAILDEIGELTHELKGNWCWWKKTQAPVDNDKVLGELVDIWHFILSWQNHFGNGKKWYVKSFDTKESVNFYLEVMKKDKKYFFDILCDLVNWQIDMIRGIIEVTEYLGFTVEQVYKAYCDKNKVNYQRLKEGY